jgi:regulatory protein
LTLQASVQDSATRLQHALDLGCRYLGHRDRTVFEMRRHLESKRVEPETIEAALAEFARLGNLDDARFAGLFAEDRRTLDGWGPERIERRLTQLGVDPELIAAATARDPEEELDAALAVLRRRLAAPPEDDRARDRALGLLVRRGYDLDTAYAAVRRFSAAA